MERGRSLERTLEEDVAALLSDPEGATLERIDDLLNDCAAVLVRLGAEQLRIQRALDRAIAAHPEPTPEGEPSLRELSTQSGRLATETARVRELTEALRARRDQISRALPPRP